MLTVCSLDSILPKTALITRFDEVAVVGTVMSFGGDLLPSLEIPVSWWSSLLSTDRVDNDSPLSEFEAASLKQDTKMELHVSCWYNYFRILTPINQEQKPE